MNKKTGGPAFPVTLFEGQTLGDGTANGMTLRDYFAAKAMQAVITSADFNHSNFSVHAVARDAYCVADAMLAARSAA